MPKSFYQLYQELDDQHAKTVAKHTRNRSTVFGTNLRIVIPLTTAETAEFQRNLETEDGQVDLKAGTITTQIQTQQGPKTQVIPISTYIAKKARFAKNNPEELEKWQELLNWWSKNKPTLGREGNHEDEQGVSIIISRAPIDIVRMSDHDEWTSCHAPGREYFHCALQEAKTGGAVAYVVYNSDLKTVTNLQATDIFKDDDRGIEGIEPLERLRLRRFTHKGDEDQELLVPEIRTYGTKHVGFKEAVVNWARHAQRAILSDPDYDDFDDWELRGGSYQDNDADDIFNQLTGKDTASGNKKTIDKSDEDENTADAMQERAEQQIAEHKYEHWHVTAQAEDSDGHPYLWMDGSAVWEFDEKFFLKIPEDKDLQTWQSGGRDGAKVPWGSYLKQQLDWDLDISEQLYIDDKGDVIRIHISARPESGMDNDDLERFLDNLDEMDKKHEDHERIIWQSLIAYGFVEEPETPQFTHFKIDPEDGEMVSDWMWVGDMDGVPDAHFNSSGHGMQDSGMAKLDLYGAVQKPETIKQVGQVFGGIPEEMVTISVNRALAGLKKVYIKIHVFLPSNPGKRQQLIQKFQQIDQHWDYFYKRAAAWWAKVKTFITPKATSSREIQGAWNGPVRTPEPAQNRQMQFPYMQVGGTQKKLTYAQGFKDYVGQDVNTPDATP